MGHRVIHFNCVKKVLSNRYHVLKIALRPEAVTQVRWVTRQEIEEKHQRRSTVFGIGKF
jgi:hypothetical protein